MKLSKIVAILLLSLFIVQFLPVQQFSPETPFSQYTFLSKELQPAEAASKGKSGTVGQSIVPAPFQVQYLNKGKYDYFTCGQYGSFIFDKTNPVFAQFNGGVENVTQITHSGWWMLNLTLTSKWDNRTVNIMDANNIQYLVGYSLIRQSKTVATVKVEYMFRSNSKPKISFDLIKTSDWVGDSNPIFALLSPLEYTKPSGQATKQVSKGGFERITGVTKAHLNKDSSIFSSWSNAVEVDWAGYSAELLIGTFDFGLSLGKPSTGVFLKFSTVPANQKTVSIDPTVATSTTTNALAWGGKTHVHWESTNNLYWQPYCDGTNWVIESSSDGTTWTTAPVTLIASWIRPVAFAFQGTVIHMAYGTFTYAQFGGTVTGYMYYKRGTITGATSITLDSAVATYTWSQSFTTDYFESPDIGAFYISFHYFDIIIGTDNYLSIVFTRNGYYWNEPSGQTAAIASRYVYAVVKSTTTTGSTWGTATTIETSNFGWADETSNVYHAPYSGADGSHYTKYSKPVLYSLASAVIGCFVNTGGVGRYHRSGSWTSLTQFDGSIKDVDAWGSVAGGNGGGKAVLLCVDSDDTVDEYRDDGSTVSSDLNVFSATVSCPTIASVNVSSGAWYGFVISGTSIVYKKYSGWGGSWDGSATDYATGLTSPADLSSARTTLNSVVLLSYRTGSASPYNIVFGTLTLNSAPVNGATSFTDPDDTDNLYAQKKLYTFTSIGTDTEGYADIAYMLITGKNGANTRFQFKYDQDTDTFSTVSGSSEWTLDATSSDSSAGNQITCTWKIAAQFDAIGETVTVDVYVIDGAASPDSDTGVLSFDVITRLVVSGFTITNSLDVGGTITASGTVYFATTPTGDTASTSYPPDAEFTSVSVHNSTHGVMGTDSVIVNGAFSLTFTQPIGTSFTYHVYINLADADGTDQDTVDGDTVTQYKVTITSSGISADSSGTVVTLDGQAKTQAQLPYDRWCISGYSLTYTFANPVSTTDSNKRYAWSSTSGLSQTLVSNTFAVSATGTITGTYTVQYQVIFAVSGMVADTSTNTVVTVASVAKTYADLPFGSWVASGGTITYVFSFPISTTDSNRRYGLSSVGGLSQSLSSNTITVSSGGTVTGTYLAGWQITFASSGIGADTTGTVVTVNALGKAQASLPYTSWLNNSASVVYSFTLNVSAIPNKQYGLASVSGLSQTLSSNTFAASSGGTITGTYNTQWQITVTSSGISTDSSGTVITLDGATRTQSVLPFSKYFNNSYSLSFAFASPVYSSIGKGYFWQSTSGLSQTLQSNSFSVSTSGTITGTYTLSTLTVYVKTMRYDNTTALTGTTAYLQALNGTWFNSAVNSSSYATFTNPGTGPLYIKTQYQGSWVQGNLAVVLDATTETRQVLCNVWSVTFTFKDSSGASISLSPLVPYFTAPNTTVTTPTATSGVVTFLAQNGSWTYRPMFQGVYVKSSQTVDLASGSPTAVSVTCQIYRLRIQVKSSTDSSPASVVLNNVQLQVTRGGVNILGSYGLPSSVYTDSNGNYTFTQLAVQNSSYIITASLSGAQAPQSSTVSLTADGETVIRLLYPSTGGTEGGTYTPGSTTPSFLLSISYLGFNQTNQGSRLQLMDGSGTRIIALYDVDLYGKVTLEKLAKGDYYLVLLSSTGREMNRHYLVLETDRDVTINLTPQSMSTVTVGPGDVAPYLIAAMASLFIVYAMLRKGRKKSAWE